VVVRIDEHLDLLLVLHYIWGVVLVMKDAHAAQRFLIGRGEQAVVEVGLHLQ
jgi:hypothetical protein